MDRHYTPSAMQGSPDSPPIYRQPSSSPRAAHRSTVTSRMTTRDVLPSSTIDLNRSSGMPTRITSRSRAESAPRVVAPASSTAQISNPHLPEAPMSLAPLTQTYFANRGTAVSPLVSDGESTRKPRRALKSTASDYISHDACKHCGCAGARRAVRRAVDRSESKQIRKREVTADSHLKKRESRKSHKHESKHEREHVSKNGREHENKHESKHEIRDSHHHRGRKPLASEVYEDELTRSYTPTSPRKSTKTSRTRSCSGSSCERSRKPRRNTQHKQVSKIPKDKIQKKKLQEEKILSSAPGYRAVSASYPVESECSKMPGTSSLQSEKRILVAQRGVNLTESDSTRSSERSGRSSSSSSSMSSGSESSTEWDINHKYIKAVRAGPQQCPDYVLAKHPAFGSEKRPSPFMMYYFDETAPNEVLLANDVKGEHPVVVAKKNLKSFLGCQGGKTDTFEVEGETYTPIGVPESVSIRGRGDDSEDESVAFAASYYTESAFTSVSANAIVRGRAWEKKQGTKQADKKGCCGRGRKMSAPSTMEELTEMTQDQSVTPRQISTHRFTGQHDVSGVRSSPFADTMPASRLYSIRNSAVPEPLASVQRKCSESSPMIQRFSKLRQTNYVEYIPPAVLANQYGHAGYQQVLIADSARRQKNEHIPAVYPQPSPPARADPYDRRATSTVSSVKPGTFSSRRDRSSSQVPRRSRPSRRQRHVSTSSSSSSCSSSSVTIQKHPRGRAMKNQKHQKHEMSRRASSSYRMTTCSATGTNQQQPSVKPCPRCKGKGHLKDAEGRSSLCGQCCLVKRPGESKFCCGGKNDTMSVASRTAYTESSCTGSYQEMARSATIGSSYRELPRSATLDGTFSDEVLSFHAGSAIDMGSESSVHRYKPSTKAEKERDYGYHVRKHFFEATKLKLPEEGTEFKKLPQYSVSYKNYPTICYDVVVPTSNKDFFRARKAPGFAA